MNHAPSDFISSIPSSSHHSSSHVSPSHSSQDGAAAGSPNEDPQHHVKKIRKRYKTQFLDHLIRQLDIMIYYQLSILYYMDCSLLTFVVRALNHWIYFTPKPHPLPPVFAWNRAHVVMIFGLNILFLCAHAISTPPTAGEAVREYLHGGLLMDFVGQKSPVSRVSLIGYDLMVLALQLVMLGITAEKKSLDAVGSVSASGGERPEEEAQDHDSEERGVRRSEEGTEGIELLPLRPLPEGRTADDEDRERSDLLRSTEGLTSREHPGDAFSSGQYIVATVNIVDTIRSHWEQSQPVTSGVSGDNPMGAAAAAGLASRRLRFRIRIGGRDYGS
ncbi:MAG: hypothetical protein Q9185_001806 [Variospora sp. 1 TL-2023]